MADQKQTLEEWLEKSYWWKSTNSFSLDTFGIFNLISEEDGFGGGGGSIGLFQGYLRDVLRYAVEEVGSGFYGWGHQGRAEKYSPPIIHNIGPQQRNTRG